MSLQDRVYGRGKTVSYLSRLGMYNKPVAILGSYNKPVKRLGMYNGVGTMGKSNILTELHR